MALKRDWDELVSDLSRKPWRVQVLYAVLILAASSPLASLSDTIFKWKGFFRDAVAAYSAFLAEPLLHFAQRINPGLSSQYPHIALLAALALAANIRVLLFLKQRRDVGFELLLSLALLFAVIVLPVVAVGRPLVSNGTLWMLLLLLAVQVVQFHRIGGAGRLLGYVYLSAPCALVGLAGAVNAGLSRMG